MTQEARRRALVLHRWFMIAGALLALLITIVDQALGIGKGDWFSFENVLSYFAWGAFGIDAVLATASVLVLARSEEHVVIINLVAPIVLLCVLFAFLAPTRSQRMSPEAAIAVAPRCLGGLTSWSWTEPDPLSVSVHLELSMPASNTVTLVISADSVEQYADTRILPAGKSSLDLPIARLEPGRPDSWHFGFNCDDPKIGIGYAAKADDPPRADERLLLASSPPQVYRPLVSALSSPSERTLSAKDYDLFFWRTRTWDAGAQVTVTSFLIRPATNVALDEQLAQANRRPLRELPAQLAALKGATATWWMAPGEPISGEDPDAHQVRAVQHRFERAGVQLVLSQRIAAPEPSSPDAGGAAGAADD